MKSFKSLENQNIIDFITEHYNDVDKFIEFLNLNNLKPENYKSNTLYKTDENNGSTIKKRGINVISGSDEELIFRLGDYNKDFNIDYYNQDILITPSSSTSYYVGFTGSTPVSRNPNLKVSIISFQDINRDPIIEPYWNNGFPLVYSSGVEKWLLRVYRSSNHLITNFPQAIIYKNGLFVEGERYRVTFGSYSNAVGKEFCFKMKSGSTVEGQSKFTYIHNTTGLEFNSFETLIYSDSNEFIYEVVGNDYFSSIFELEIKKIS